MAKPKHPHEPKQSSHEKNNPEPEQRELAVAGDESRARGQPAVGEAEESGPPAQAEDGRFRRRAFLAQTAAVAAAAQAALVALGEREARAQVEIPPGSIRRADQATPRVNAADLQRSGALNTTRDWMLYTDKSRTGGIFVTGDSQLAVTSAFVKGFEATYFGKNTKAAPMLSQLRAKANGLEGSKVKVPAARLDQAVAELGAAVGTFAVAAAPQALGTLSVRSDKTAGNVTLNGREVWRPDGQIMTRAAGSSNIFMVVGSLDLRGRLTPSTRLGAVGLIAGRPGITASDDGCGACGTCGLCGLCALCGEVNAGSIGAVVVEAINLSSLSSITFTPAVLDPSINRLPTGARDLQLAADDVRRSVERLSAASTRIRGV